MVRRVSLIVLLAISMLLCACSDAFLDGKITFKNTEYELLSHWYIDDEVYTNDIAMINNRELHIRVYNKDRDNKFIYTEEYSMLCKQRGLVLPMAKQTDMINHITLVSTGNTETITDANVLTEIGTLYNALKPYYGNDVVMQNIALNIYYSDILPYQSFGNIVRIDDGLVLLVSGDIVGSTAARCYAVIPQDSSISKYCKQE